MRMKWPQRDVWLCLFTSVFALKGKWFPAQEFLEGCRTYPRLPGLAGAFFGNERPRQDQEAKWSQVKQRSHVTHTQSIIVCVWNVQDAKEWMTKFAFQKRNVWSDCVAEGGWVGCQSVAEVGAELSLYDSIWHFFYWDLEILKQNHMALKFLLRIAQCQVNWNRSQKWCKGFWVSLGGEAGKRCTGGCSDKLWPLSQPEVDPQSCHWPLGKRMNWQFSQPQLALL